MNSDVNAPTDDSENPETKMSYSGTTGELFPIVVINLLLTIVTLGIYRFWARTKVRRYLWNSTKLKGDSFEYTGTGKELFFGFLIVIVTVFIPLIYASYKMQMAIMQGDQTAAQMWMAGIYVIMLYLMNVAIYRATRYRMSRTKWRGIRGGQDEKGWKFGAFSFLALLFNIITLGLTIPYTSAKLWNYEYGRKFFGNQKFSSGLDWRPIFKSFIIAFFVIVAAYVAFAYLVFGPLMETQTDLATNPDAIWSHLGKFYLAFFGLLVVIGLASSWFIACFYREASKAMAFNELGFRFDVPAKSIFLLQVGNTLILMFTLGLGANFVEQRRVRFFADNLIILGDVESMLVGQSELEQDGYGEGLADAFDMGGI